MISQNELLEGGFFGMGSGSEQAATVEGGKKRKCPKGSHRSRRAGYGDHCVKKHEHHTMYRRLKRSKSSPWEWKRPVAAKSAKGRRSKALKAYFAARRA